LKGFGLSDSSLILALKVTLGTISPSFRLMDSEGRCVVGIDLLTPTFLLGKFPSKLDLMKLGVNEFTVTRKETNNKNGNISETQIWNFAVCSHKAYTIHQQ
jgi:hypothetical protein